jgi:hypothetical protein
MRDACQVTGKPEQEAGSRIQEAGKLVAQETGQPTEQKIGDEPPEAGGEGPGAKYL